MAMTAATAADLHGSALEDDVRTDSAAKDAPRAPIDFGSLEEMLRRPGALGSPAAQLQAALDAEYALAAAEDRWPLRWTVAMVMMACGAFWLGVYFLVAAMVG